MADRVGLRELRLDTRGVVERAATLGSIEITDRGRTIAILTGVPATSSRPPKIARALSLLDRSDAADTGAYEELFADKQADIDLAER